MKLKELLETVNQLAKTIGKTRMGVKFCKECNEKGVSQEEHKEKHLQEALEIRDKLPDNLVWHPESLRIEPTLKLTIDGEGHITADLDEVEIY